MKTLRMIGWLLLAGSLAGAVVASWLAPRFIAWYNDPGPGGGAQMCPYSCAAMARNVTESLLTAQLYGVVIGAVAVTIFGLLARKAMAGDKSGAAAAAVGAPHE